MRCDTAYCKYCHITVYCIFCYLFTVCCKHGVFIACAFKQVVIYFEVYRKIVIEYMIPKSNSQSSYSGELFLCTGSVVNAESGKSVAVNYIADGSYHTVEIDLSSLSFWSGKINSIRFDFFNSGAIGDEVFIRSIRLTN